MSYQIVTSQPTRKRRKAVFDGKICEQCPRKEECSTKAMKQGRVLIFDRARVLRARRHRRINQLPEELQTLRNNIKSTMKEFTGGMNHKGKLRVRGRFKAERWALCTGIGINLKRIHRHLQKKRTKGLSGRLW